MKSENTLKFFEATQKLLKASSNMKYCNMEVHKGEFATLKCIADHTKDGNIPTISFVSRELNVTLPAVSQMINMLEIKKFVRRSTNIKDRRIVEVQLTKEGTVFMEKTLEKMFDHIDNIIFKMGKEDSEILISLLIKLEKLV